MRVGTDTASFPVALLRSVLATASREGMQTLEQSLSALVAAGTVDHQTAIGARLYPHEVVGRKA